MPRLTLPSHAFLRTLMLSGLVLTGFSATRAKAAVLLTIDISDLSAVKFTATGSSADQTFNTLSFADGIALRNFFINTVPVQDFVSTYSSSSTGLTDSTNDLPSTAIFNELTAWNDDHPEYWTGYNNESLGGGVDLTLWNQTSTGTTMFFSSGPEAAFYGEAVFDLSGWILWTDEFPAVNTTGNINLWNNNGTIGTWQVVNPSAVPEPSTYGMIGAGALVTATIMRRRRNRAK